MHTKATGHKQVSLKFSSPTTEGHATATRTTTSDMFLPLFEVGAPAPWHTAGLPAWTVRTQAMRHTCRCHSMCPA